MILLFKAEELFSEQDLQMLCRDDLCSVYQMRNNSGDGTVIYYQLYPGMAVMYNNFHSEEGTGRNVGTGHYISIHHCLEGRMESEVSSGEYLYLEPGDILLENIDAAKYRYYSFPINHYHGVSIILSVMDIAGSAVNDLLQSFSIDLLKIEEKFSLAKGPCVLHGDPLIDHILSEFYHIPDVIKGEYLKIKLLELLIALKTVDVSFLERIRPYFYKTQVEKVKDIKEFMICSPEYHYTIEELSKHFNISESSLKQCFKAIYGTAIYTYMKNYRMDIAASLLTETTESVTVIAGKVGYSNSSKFSAAFKNVKGVSPLAYRKVKI